MFAYFQLTNANPTNYNVGVGIADITGPAAQVDMMGYGKPGQTTDGIHLRQFSRAFIITDPDPPQARVVYVSADACTMSQAVKHQVIKELKRNYSSLYTERNVCISGTNTHSGPGGYHQYLLNDITSFGFVNETFEALVQGIVLSIHRAHANIQPANIYVNRGDLLSSNINRSPTAYLKNPENERKQYSYSVDKTMTVLKIVDANQNPIGVLSWFAVHGTSMNNTNRLISSDNKGYAALLFEQMMNKGALPGKGPFVAAFGSSNEGDVSPNIYGAHCLDSGKPCDIIHSTCHGMNELCVASGPGKDMFESTKIIAESQFQKALQLFNAATEPLSGPVDFRHTYTDMSQQKIKLSNNSTVKTCKPAMGYSFGAGTTDGPGAFDFRQASNSTSLVWDVARDFLRDPSREQRDCQKPKPILLDTGEIHQPYDWQPHIVDTQMLRIGRLVIIAVPAEFTTMSGRRTRQAVESTLAKEGFPVTPLSVIAGLANDDAGSVTTFEEYQAQRYEGASTVFGPYTLQAYIQVYMNLSVALVTGETVTPGPNPPDLISKQLVFLPPVYWDRPVSGLRFGDMIIPPRRKYKLGESVKVLFCGANPRNDRKAESTFLEVQFQEKDGNWTVHYTDAHWETRFIWSQFGIVAGSSVAEIQWDIPTNQNPGMYRINYYGNYKEPTDRRVYPFEGLSRPFEVETV